jgi:flavin-dependent thymidylate synthase
MIKVELQEAMGSDKSIADAAWTSSTELSKKEFKTDEDIKRVVNMLADSGHSTPFESVIFRFWIKMPIQTDRQHMTHRIGSHNGMSGRYRTMPAEFMEVPGDVSEIGFKAFDHLEADLIEAAYTRQCKEANDLYLELLKKFRQAEREGKISNTEYKRAREFYRGALPQNNMTERVTIFNLRSFCNYQKLRNSPHAQPEIRRVAELMLLAVKESNVCPVALAALERNGWNI